MPIHYQSVHQHMSINVSPFTKGKTIPLQEDTTKGDPLAMSMYVIGTIPLIHQLSNESIKQAWFTDNDSASRDHCPL